MNLEWWKNNFSETVKIITRSRKPYITNKNVLYKLDFYKLVTKKFHVVPQDESFIFVENSIIKLAYVFFYITLFLKLYERK